MNEQEQNNQDLNQKFPPPHEEGLGEVSSVHSPAVNYKLGIIVLALLAGIVGGLFGALYLAQKPFFQKMFHYSGVAGQQNLVLNEQSATTEVVKQAGPAVVSIVISKKVTQAPQNIFDPFGVFGNLPNDQTDSGELRQVGAGTGFFISNDGMIVTNKHVVADDAAQYSVVTNDGKSYDAKVLSRDPVNDIAIIKIDINNAPFLQFSDSSSIELGQHVIAIGNSLGEYQNTVTTGIISGIGRSITAGGMGIAEQLDGVIQTDAAINAGNSGGPLLDMSGRVVGINTAADRQGQSIGFAIPSNDVKVALDSYKANGKISRPFLGVRYMMITEAVAKSEKLPQDFGALIIRGSTATDFAVQPGSPADKAGLAENDIIMEVNGEKLNEQNSLARVLKKFKPNDSLSLKVFSKGQEKSVNVTLGENQ